LRKHLPLFAEMDQICVNCLDQLASFTKHNGLKMPELPAEYLIHFLYTYIDDYRQNFGQLDVEKVSFSVFIQLRQFLGQMHIDQSQQRFLLQCISSYSTVCGSGSFKL
jgi:hypothetical protein